MLARTWSCKVELDVVLETNSHQCTHTSTKASSCSLPKIQRTCSWLWTRPHVQHGNVWWRDCITKSGTCPHTPGQMVHRVMGLLGGHVCKRVAAAAGSTDNKLLQSVVADLGASVMPGCCPQQVQVILVRKGHAGEAGCDAEGQVNFMKTSQAWTDLAWASEKWWLQFGWTQMSGAQDEDHSRR